MSENSTGGLFMKTNPCFRCGSDRVYIGKFRNVEECIYSMPPNFWGVVCNKCGITTRPHRHKEDAVSDWNYYPPKKPLQDPTSSTPTREDRSTDGAVASRELYERLVKVAQEILEHSQYERNKGGFYTIELPIHLEDELEYTLKQMTVK